MLLLFDETVIDMASDSGEGRNRDKGIGTKRICNLNISRFFREAQIEWHYQNMIFNHVLSLGGIFSVLLTRLVGWQE